MLVTPPQDKLHKHLHTSNACEHSWIMMIMVGSKMFKAEYDLKAIMYPAYDTPHKLCNIRGDWNIQQPRLPSNYASRPMRQFKCPLTWLKWRAGSPPFQHVNIDIHLPLIQCYGTTQTVPRAKALYGTVVIKRITVHSSFISNSLSCKEIDSTEIIFILYLWHGHCA